MSSRPGGPGASLKPPPNLNNAVAEPTWWYDGIIRRRNDSCKPLWKPCPNVASKENTVMSDWGVGYAIGIFTGLAIGLVVGRRQKPWAELTQKQRRIMIGSIAAGVVLLAVGIVVALTLMR
jgi:hypothetical protein